ncbi:hypothetical protein Tco_0732519 [Tanacetum coccineum]
MSSYNNLHDHINHSSAQLALNFKAFRSCDELCSVYITTVRKTVSKVHDTKDTIKFKLDRQKIVYTVDMFHDNLHLLVETPNNPFIAPVNIKVIESFMQKVGYQGIVNKVSAFYYDVSCFNVAEEIYSRLEPVSHKENPEHVDDDDENETGKKHEKKDNVEDNVNGIYERDMERKCVTTGEFWKVHGKLDKVLCEIVHQIAERATNDLIEGNLRIVVGYHSSFMTRDAFSSSTATTSSADLQQQLYLKMKSDIKDQANDLTLWDVLKRKFKKSSPFHLLEKCDAFTPDIMNDITRSYVYHLEQSTYFIEKNQIVWESRQEDIRRSKAKALIFYGPQRNPNEPLRSRVIWERVHDFQLGIESYHIKVNLTTPTLTFHGIEVHDLYSIVDKPDTGLIYLNNKDEKRVMYLVEIVKFCDATLKKVLKEVKLRIFQNEFWKKPPLLGELDLDIMKTYEREITKR